MASVLNAPYFQDETAAYTKLESIVWPHGPVCPHCEVKGRMKLMGGNATRPGLYKCYACRKQSRVTVGTVFESSHIKLHVWLQAAFLMCSSKKGISSNQLARILGLTVKSAWFMSHRLREAMTDGTMPDIFGGEGSIVEIDETFIGTKKGAVVARGYRHKNAVLSLVERRPEGARVISFHVDGTSPATLMPIIKAHVAKASFIMTDEAGQYARLSTHFAGHDFTTHTAGEYVRGKGPNAVHTNTVEGFYSVFKRGMKGVYQHCSEAHLSRYVAEFDFRYNTRVRFGIDDVSRTEIALKNIVGKRLMYKDSSGV
jgi:transposase-like protein